MLKHFLLCLLFELLVLAAGALGLSAMSAAHRADATRGLTRHAALRNQARVRMTPGMGGNPFSCKPDCCDVPDECCVWSCVRAHVLVRRSGRRRGETRMYRTPPRCVGIDLRCPPLESGDLLEGQKTRALGGTRVWLKLSSMCTEHQVANITITDSILTPFQCEEHPNGMMTLQEYKQVVCWNSEFDPQHKTMVVVALVAVLIPVAFLSLCVWVVVSLPARERQGDATFLRAFAFLFYRYRSGAYWYAVVLVLRNTCVVMVPIIADEALQLCALVVVSTPCAFLSFSVFLWRVHFANLLDVATNAGFLLTIFLTALSVESVDRNLVGEFLIGIFLVLATLFVAAGTLALHLIFVRRGKPFQYFLCHHKIGGGGFARLLQVLLKVNPSVSRDVFLDADNLQDLALLFEYVANKTETLVVLCTAKIMSRVWCLGEMTTAQLHKVDAILVLFPDFEWPSAEFINNCAEYREGRMSHFTCLFSIKDELTSLHKKLSHKKKNVVRQMLVV